MKADLHDRFWQRVEQGPQDVCWPWLGYINTVTGYGEWSRVGRAHRLAWELTFGPIPEHLQVDHLCNTRTCCNPRHMQLLNPSVHALKSITTRWGTIGNATVCRHGHIGERRHNRHGEPYCRACVRERTRQWRQRQKAAK